MDGKLAKGYAKEGFRRDLKNADGVSDRMMEVLAPHINKLTTTGKLSKANVKSLLDDMEVFKSDPHHTLFVERFLRKGLSQVSAQYEGGIAGGYFSPMKSNMLGVDEKARAFSLFYDRYSRHEIELRTFDLPIYVREHAISRFLERTDARYGQTTTSLFPGFLIIAALELVSPTAIARPYMLPAPGGAFLGVSVLATGKAEPIVKLRLTGSQSDSNPLRAREWPDGLRRMSFVNTFVSDDQMSSHQEALKERIVGLIQEHRDMLLFALLAQVMVVGGERDVMGLDGILKGDVDVMIEQFNGLVSGPAWIAGVRAPQEGRFMDYFVAQGMLERQSVTSLQ